MIPAPPGPVEPRVAARMAYRFSKAMRVNQGTVGTRDQALKIFQAEELRCFKEGDMRQLDALRRSQFTMPPTRGESGTAYSNGWGYYMADGGGKRHPTSRPGTADSEARARSRPGTADSESSAGVGALGTARRSRPGTADSESSGVGALGTARRSRPGTADSESSAGVGALGTARRRSRSRPSTADAAAAADRLARRPSLPPALRAIAETRPAGLVRLFPSGPAAPAAPAAAPAAAKSLTRVWTAPSLVGHGGGSVALVRRSAAAVRAREPHGARYGAERAADLGGQPAPGGRWRWAGPDAHTRAMWGRPAQQPTLRELGRPRNLNPGSLLSM